MIVEKIKVRKSCYRVKCKCDWCGKKFEKKYGDTKKTKHHFCSKKCYGQWSSKNRVGKNHPTFGKHLSKEWRDNLSKNHANRKGENHPMWKGGRNKNDAGYILVYKPHHPYSGYYGQVREHRLVMEKKIGRYLKPKEVVHHINGIKDDNRIENLMLFKNNKQHMDYHTLIESKN